jgi:phospholipase/carboxylesterase
MLKTELIPAVQKDSHRLMVVLHGLGDSMEGYRWMPQAMDLDSLHYLLVNAPDDYYGGFSWYNFPGDATPGVQRSTRLLFKLLDDLRGQGFPSDQTWLFGFSQGCMMTLEAGLRYPHKLAGLIGVSGYALDPERLLLEKSPVATQQRILLTHGTWDPLIPIQRTRAQVQFLRAGGLQIQWREFAKEHTIAGEAEISVIREFVTGAG